MKKTKKERFPDGGVGVSCWHDSLSTWFHLSLLQHKQTYWIYTFTQSFYLIPAEIPVTIYWTCTRTHTHTHTHTHTSLMAEHTSYRYRSKYCSYGIKDIKKKSPNIILYASESHYYEQTTCDLPKFCTPPPPSNCLIFKDNPLYLFDVHPAHLHPHTQAK